MRWRTIAIACLGFAALSAGAQVKDFNAYGLITCGDFMANKDSAAVRMSVGNYARGFVTGANAMRPDKKMVRAEISDNTVVLYLEKFCRDNPLENTNAGIYRMGWELAK